MGGAKVLQNDRLRQLVNVGLKWQGYQLTFGDSEVM